MDSDFLRQGRGGIVFYECRALAEIPGVRHGFSTRHGGSGPQSRAALNLGRVSWDTAENVQENRRGFLEALGLAPASLRTLSQVHSDRVRIIEENSGDWNSPTRPPEGDGMITALPAIALGIQVADCFPVLVADPKRGVIANLHAGWRGTAARIAEKGVRTIVARFGCEPADLRVAIGPGIRSCCFEVGPEVAAAFEAGFPGAALARPRPGSPGKHLVDLPRALRDQLQTAGVRDRHIFDLGACTRCHLDEFFSYRGEGPRAGRLMAVIARS